MAGWRQPGWQDFRLTADCDLWLLTEVDGSVELPGYAMHRGVDRMGPRRHWAEVFSRMPLRPLPDPPVASAAAVVGSITYCSSILPWRCSGGGPTWPEAELPRNLHSEGAGDAVEILLRALPQQDLVWGGDWNHALSGDERANTKGGRPHVLTAVEVPTQ